MAEAAPTAFVPLQNDTDLESPNTSGYKPYMDSKPPEPAPPLPDSFDFPTNLPTPPFISVDGVPNFRDLGGYIIPNRLSANKKPLMFRRNLLYRCAHPQLITDKGKHTLVSTLNIKHVYDFRSAPEVKKLTASLTKPTELQPEKPDPETIDPRTKDLEIPGTTRHFTPVYEEEDYSPDVLAKKMKWYTSPVTASNSLSPNARPYDHSEGFIHAYRDIALNAGTGPKPAYPTIIKQLLAHPEEPVLFHCTAGKDRTGVLGALLLKLAGVDLDTICWEYALTEPGLGNWRELFITRIVRSGMGMAGSKATEARDHDVLTRDEAARIVGSRSGNIRAFIEVVVDGECGGVERYFIDKLGISEADVQKLKDLLVVEVQNESEVVKPTEIERWTPEGGVQD